MKQKTIIHLESMWKPGLSARKDDIWAPNDSVSPFLSMMCGHWGANYIYRQIHSVEDLTAWCQAVAKTNKTHSKILWLSGHGGKKKAFCIYQGDESKEISIKTIMNNIRKAGQLTGLVLDSCSIGKHINCGYEIARNVSWVLATDKDVDFVGSSFLFAKAVEWLIDGKSRNAARNFLSGMSTDNEDKKSEYVSYDSLIRTMGMHLFYRNKTGFAVYPDRAQEKTINISISRNNENIVKINLS